MTRATWRVWVLAGLLLGTAAGAQEIRIVDRGAGPSGALLAGVLATPHRVVEPDTAWFVLPRTQHERRSLVVLGRTAAIAGTVDGDVIVVGGDLFVRPGARITGRAIAIGGGAYPSRLAVIVGGSQSHRDNTFDILREPDGTYRLSYRSLYADRSPPLLFPGLYGLRVPAYDRVNGLSLPFGPALTMGNGSATLNAVVTYRSDLGKLDPALTAHAQLTRRLRLAGFLGRGTFSNDDWIWSNLVNSFSSLAFGKDTRNYFRADRGEATAHRLWETSTLVLQPLVGVRGERSWAVGPAVGEARGPWSLFGRTDTLDGIWRPNPAVPDADILSILAGSTLQSEAGGVNLRARTVIERSAHSRVRVAGLDADVPFTQVTTDVAAGFITFGEQEYALDVHWVTTPAGPAPPQRFVYLGGSGTMPFLDLLEQGGDELLLVDQRYSIPVPRVNLGLLGMPTLQLRHRMGSAGLGALPTLEQVIGVGVHLTIVRAELQMDPVSRDVRFSMGFTFSR